MVALTIGMATYNDFDGVYFTIQALRLYQDLADTELLVVDNFGCAQTRQFIEGLPDARYILAPDVQGTAAPRDRAIREAIGEAVLCCDSHVLLVPGAIARLKGYFRDHPESPDLLQGPLIYDDLQNIATHFDPVWREQMWGAWATDPRGLDPDGEPFEIPMQGLGLFACRKAAWPRFNPAFRGFGGEEGYLHEKFRQRGGRCLCLPWLRWGHRFGRPAGVPYPLTVEDKLRNYAIGHAELGLDLEPVTAHFTEHLPRKRVREIVRSARVDQEVATLPLVSCICPTYNRAPGHQHLIEEAIESFLRQTWPHKELIVLNDCPEQELMCDAPGVRVVNHPQRFMSLGEKYNAGIALARGELIANWDDDDISLPWRLSLSVERLGDADYFNPRISWFMATGTLQREPSRGVGHNLSLFRESAFATAGGYPPISLGVDAAMDEVLTASALCRGAPRNGDPELDREDWFYLYRWGVSPAHLSGSRNADYWQHIGEQPVQPGRFTLRPHWRQDYAVAIRRFSREITSHQDRKKRRSGDGKLRRKHVLVYVAGDAETSRKHRAARQFPLLTQREGEPAARHLDRVMGAIDDAVLDGGTHLLIPRKHTSWLEEHPLLEDHFAASHVLVEANRKLGLVFDLRRRPGSPVTHRP